MVEVLKIMATFFKRSHARTAVLNAPNPAAGHHQPTPPLETPGHSRASLGQSLVGSLLLSPGSWCTQGSVCALWESDHNHRKLTKMITWTTALSNSVKLWATSCRAAQDGRVIVKRSDKMWSTGEGNGNHFSILALRTPWTVWKGKMIEYWKRNSPGQ